MPTPTPALLQRLQHLSKAEQRQWLDQWSKSLLEGREPPAVPPLAD